MAKVIVEFVNLKEARLGVSAACGRIADVLQQKGHKVLIRTASEAQARELDQGMWTFAPDSFVPHALAGNDDEADEPVLISYESTNPNGADVVILVDPPKELPLKDFAHIIQLIPAQEDPALQACRAHYKAMSQRGDVELVHTTRV